MRKSLVLAIMLLILYLPVTAFSEEFISIRNYLVAIIDYATINYNLLQDLLIEYSGYNVSLNNYLISTTINNSQVLLFSYRPWYDPYYIVALCNIETNQGSKVIIWIYGGIQTTNTSHYDAETILYIELGYLLRLRIITNTTTPVYESIKIYNSTTQAGIEDIASTLLSINPPIRPKWELLESKYAVGASYLGGGYSETTTTESTQRSNTWAPPPLAGGFASTLTSSETIVSKQTYTSTTKPASSSTSSKEIYGETSRSGYYSVLISFITAIIASLIIYIVLKKT